MADEVVILSDSEDEGQGPGQVSNGSKKGGSSITVKVEPKNVRVNGDCDGQKEIDLSDDVAEATNGVSGTGIPEDDDDLQFIEELMAGPSGSQHGSQGSDEKSEGDLLEPEEESPDRLAVKSALENLFLNLRGIRGKVDMTPLQRKKVRASYLAMLDDVDMTQDNVKDRLLELISAAEVRLQEKKKVPWKALEDLKQFMARKKIGKKAKNSEKKDETEDERRERKNRQRIVVLEERLAKLEKLIADWEEKDVDLDDETNSSYLVKDRLQKSYMKAYNELCRATGSNYHTGRPIEKSIRLKDDITRYPEVKEAVEKFVNSKNCLFVPDFCDIQKVVKTVNMEPGRAEVYPEEEGPEIAHDLFKAVLCKIKKRQEADVKVALPEWHKVNINPEADPELERKLQENAKQWKNEHEVIEKFVQRQQELQAEAQVVLDEDADQSAPESDDDLDTEDEEGDAEDSDNIDPAAESREEYRRDLVDPDDDIISDDDEEEQVAPVISPAPENLSTDDPPAKRQKVNDSL